MKYGTAWGTAVAMLAGGCLVKPYTREVVIQTSTEQIGSSRDVQIGLAFDAAAVPGTDLAFQVTSRKQCRSATSSADVTSRSTYHWKKKRQNLPFLWVATGLGAGIASALTLTLGDSTNVGVGLAGVGAYFLGLGFYQSVKRSYGGSSNTDEIIRKDEPTWEWLDSNEDIHIVVDCDGIEPVPAEGRTARIAVTFAETNWTYWYDKVSDASGLIQIEGALARAQRVAALCGDGTFTITDTTEDPLAVIDVEHGHYSFMAREGSTTRLEGTPEEPPEGNWRFRSAVLAAPAVGPASYDGLAGGELQTAQECYKARVERCVENTYSGNWDSLGVEEDCARTQGTLDCLFAYRRASDKATTDQSRSAADTMLRECRIKAGGDVSAEESCHEDDRLAFLARARVEAEASCQ